MELGRFTFLLSEGRRGRRKGKRIYVSSSTPTVNCHLRFAQPGRTLSNRKREINERPGKSHTLVGWPRLLCGSPLWATHITYMWLNLYYESSEF